MKEILILLSILIMLNGCVASNKLPVSTEHVSSQKNSQKNCEFDLVDEPSFKLSNNTTNISLNVRSTPDKRNYDMIRNKSTQNFLVGKMIKVVSFVPDTSITSLFVDKYRLFSARGKKHIYATGFFKAITEDCNIVYFEAKDIFEDYTDLLTKASSQPLDGEDKLILAKHFEGIVAGLQVTVAQDEFEGNKWVSTPNINDSFLRALIDLSTNQLNFIQIYATTEHYSDWAHLDRAKDRQQNSFPLVQIDTDVDCSSVVGCTMYESVGIIISQEYLASHSDGIEIQATGRKGKSMIHIPSKSITLMLDALKIHIPPPLDKEGS